MPSSQDDNIKLIIAGSDLPKIAADVLRGQGALLLFDGGSFAYPPIGAHPDVFLFINEGSVVYAPETPSKILDNITKTGATMIKGQSRIGNKYPETAPYNCVMAGDYLIHKQGITDASILACFQEHIFIHVPQAYTRCSLMALDYQNYITSDRMIEKALKMYGFNVLYVTPDAIKLPGFRHGFIGGCMGVFNKVLYLSGALAHFKEAEAIKNFIASNGYKIKELSPDPPVDCGGIFFL